MPYKTLEGTIGNTPLVQLRSIPGDEAMVRRLAAEEDIFRSVSAAGVFVVCGRGDRYLSTGLFHAQAAAWRALRRAQLRSA